MESTESSEKQLPDQQQQQKSNGTPVKQSDSDYNYEDDFEELDSFIKEKSGDSSGSNSATINTSSDNTARKDVFHKPESTPDSDSQQEKGQLESSGETPSEKDSTDSGAKPTPVSSYDDNQSDDSEPEPEGDVLFTDDQQRAMMELMAQKHDSGDYSDDPPEYNVKERLKELNAELAMEPDPDDRQHRVGFKEVLVELEVPPEVSDDDESPRKTLAMAGEKEKGPEEGGDKKKQFVVERDGKFDVVADHELTASERAMFNIPEPESTTGSDSKDNQNKAGSGGGGGDNQASSQNSSSAKKDSQQPIPPSKPRPNTANGYPRRNVRPAQSPRPQTASSNRYSSSHSSVLQDFNYVSQYAMSPSEKERAQERARLREQQRKDEEERRKQEEEYRRQEAEDCFRAWLQRKRDEDHRKRQEEEERRKREGKEDRSLDSESFQSEDSESKENEEAFKGWLKEKQTQTKREKLLKKREEQEIKDGYYVRSREECDQAYKEWLKQKYAEIRRQKMAEKQRVKSFRSQARKSRKQQMMARAVRQSQAFRYVDYYGYRF